MSRYQAEPQPAGLLDLRPWDAPEIEHLDGVWWHHAPPPPRRHTHWVQSRGWVGFDFIERCPCGALRRDRRVWLLLYEPRLAPEPPSLWRRLLDRWGSR